jgi:bifunctional lysine-specific demethylase and histidyl-hydroxylase NO66
MTADLTHPSSAGASTDAPAPDGSVLRWITGMDPGEFATQHWGRRPLLVQPADTGAFRDLLDLDGVDELLSRRGLRTPFVRLARDGEVIGSSAFTAPGGVGAEIGDQVRDDKVADLFSRGATVVLQALHRTWSPVVDLATALGVELGHPVQANAYVTPPDSRGFSAHYDVHDVFVLQLAGSKRWRVHAPVHPDPLRTQPWTDHAAAVRDRSGEEPAFEVVLSPGDVLYLPRGWLHAATALGGVSAHLTVGVHVVTGYALVEALVATVAGDPGLRATLPIGLDVADPDQLAPHLDAVRAALHAALDAVNPSDIARRLRTGVWGGARLEPVRPLATAAFIEQLGTGDAVRVRAGLGYRLVDAGAGGLTLELPDRSIGLPPSTKTALRALLGGGTAVVGDLPDLSAAEQVVLVARLLREGVVVPAPPS